MEHTEPLFSLDIAFGTPAFDEALALRDRILRKPLKMVFSEHDIAKEYDQKHIGCYNADYVLLGCLTLMPKSKNEVQMRQVAVDASFQKMGIGRHLVQSAESWAKTAGYQTIIVNARDVSVPFYKKMNYKKHGKPFTEVGIKHYLMKKKV